MFDRRASKAPIARHGHANSMAPEIFFVTVTIQSIGVWILTAASLLLPAISLACFVSAAVVALAAWCLSSDRFSNGITLWDVSGAYAFIGCATSMLSNPHAVLAI
jgi:hypothetical protein